MRIRVFHGKYLKIHVNYATFRIFDKIKPLYKILGAEGFDSGDNRFFLPLYGFQNTILISDLLLIRDKVTFSWKPALVVQQILLDRLVLKDHRKHFWLCSW